MKLMTVNCPGAAPVLTLTRISTVRPGNCWATAQTLPTMSTCCRAARNPACSITSPMKLMTVNCPGVMQAQRNRVMTARKKGSTTRTGGFCSYLLLLLLLLLLLQRGLPSSVLCAKRACLSPAMCPRPPVHPLVLEPCHGQTLLAQLCADDRL